MKKIYRQELKFKQPIFLSFLGKGMEGSVWQTNDNLAYKHFRHLGFHEYEKSKMEKIKILSQLELHRCCIPKTLVIDDKGQLQGYLMKLEKRHYHIDKLKIEDQLDILCTILNMIDEQQKYQVYNLDLSFQNIIINKYKEPIFIDLDNFYVGQIQPEAYPPKLKFCTQIYYWDYLYDFQLRCFCLYIVEVISRTDINFILQNNRSIITIKKEVSAMIEKIIKRYNFSDELTNQFLDLFRNDYQNVTIVEINHFLTSFKKHVENQKEEHPIKTYVKTRF